MQTKLVVLVVAAHGLSVSYLPKAQIQRDLTLSLHRAPCASSAPLVSRVSSSVRWRPHASRDSIGSSARTCANELNSLVATRSGDERGGLLYTIGGDFLATHVIPTVKASTPLASSLGVPPAGGGQAASREKQRRKARSTLERALSGQTCNLVLSCCTTSLSARSESHHLLSSAPLSGMLEFVRWTFLCAIVWLFWHVF